MLTPVERSEIRDQMKLFPDVVAASATDTPDHRNIYIVSDHAEALRFGREIVVGDRGVGKSFWSSVLVDSSSKKAISEHFPDLHLSNINVSLGFAEGAGKGQYPTSRVIAGIMANGHAPDLIWRAVILNTFVDRWPLAGWPDKWADRVEWLRGREEDEETYLRTVDEALGKSRLRQMIVFDALDRLSNSWQNIRSLARALIESILYLRSFSNISAKVFMRPDMDDDSVIWNVRDGSKLRQNKVNLVWPVKDIHGFFGISF